MPTLLIVRNPRTQSQAKPIVHGETMLTIEAIAERYPGFYRELKEQILSSCEDDYSIADDNPLALVVSGKPEELHAESGTTITLEEGQSVLYFKNLESEQPQFFAQIKQHIFEKHRGYKVVKSPPNHEHVPTKSTVQNAKPLPKVKTVTRKEKAPMSRSKFDPEIDKDDFESSVKADWNSSKPLRAEFGGRFKDYRAYRKALAQNKVSMHGVNRPEL